MLWNRFGERRVGGTPTPRNESDNLPVSNSIGIMKHRS